MTTPTAWHEAAARALEREQRHARWPFARSRTTKPVPACPDCTPGGPHFGDCPNSKFEPISERDEDEDFDRDR